MAFNDEIAKTKAPEIAELYEISIGSEFFRYTSFERDVVFSGETYEAVAIKRSDFKKKEKLQKLTVDIDTILTTPIVRFLALGPTPAVKIKILQDILNTGDCLTLFNGRVINVSMTDDIAKVKCESTRLLFGNKLPRWTYSSQCNNELYDSECTVDKNSFKTTTAISLSVDGLTLSASAFGMFSNDYFNLGHVETSFGDFRTITDHTGNDIVIKSVFDSRFVDGATVNVYPGCDKQITTCDTKFSNKPQFKGFIYIPENNPSAWGVHV